MTAPATTADLQQALRARDRAAINHLAGRLLEQKTALGEQWFSVAHVLVRTGEVQLARAAAERGVEEASRSAQARFQLAHILSITGRQDDAIALASAISPEELNPLQLDHFLGTCALEVGDFDLARSALERVLDSWQGSGATWLSLAAVPGVDDATLLDRLDAARATIESTPADSQARWHYARGTLLDRLQRFDEAFSAFAAGAELVRPTRPYDAQADLADAKRLTNDYTEAAVQRVAKQVRSNTARPILVTGLPRSGTTLVEHLLTGHSGVAGGGEMPFASILRREIGGNSLSQLESFASTQGADHLADLYLHLGDQHFGAGQRFVDKGLDASREMGILASVLPQARIIWLRRDPLDCAWSCFRTYFSKGLEWSWSLADIGAHFSAEDQLFSHWRAVLGERMLTLRYEDLAADPQSEIDRILAHVQLDPEPVMEAMGDTSRAVTTASVAQVRQPVYTSSVGTAAPYREHLAPFVDTYRPT